MPRQSGISVENNFIKGLITEISPLKFPENASTDTDNCVYDQTGKVSRRLGFDFEENSTATALTVDNNAKSSFTWKNVAEEGDLSFVVIQNGTVLHFYTVSGDSSLSGNKHADTVDLTDFLPAGGTNSSIQTRECQYAAANGKLIVTHPKLEAFYVDYDVDTDTISSTEITIKIRDTEGDTADVLYVPPFDTRPTSTLGALNASHRYNLENQGWTSTTLTSWDTARTDMPSNCDVSWYFKTDTDPGTAFDFSLVANLAIGNSKAANGHFIYNLYDVDRATNVAGATEFAIEFDRLSTCAFFAGRVWYAGLKYQNYNSKVFFSQIIENAYQFGLCYTSNDPTSELTSDLLASDGGYIDLLEAGNILKMVPVLNTLFVFCTNGVWAITGSQGTGFTANDFSVTKISDTPNVSHCSFVRTEDSVFWWSHTGIYTINKDQQTNKLSVTNITDVTIKEFFYEIPLDARELARGIYDSLNKRVQWLYRDATANSFTQKYQFDRVLNLSTLTGALYPWTIDTTDVKIHELVSVTGAGGALVENEVTAALGVNNVQAASGVNNVVVFQSANSSIDSVTKFFVSYTDSGVQTTFAEEYRDTYLDWTTFDDVGVDFTSYFVTGYRLRGEAIRKHQSNYVRIYTDNDTASSFTIKGIWDFAIDGTRGRFSEIQGIDQAVVISDDTSYSVKSKRVKIRGHGLVLQLMFSSMEGEPFDIVGWVTWDTVNERV
jgi:hypothetical protein